LSAHFYCLSSTVLLVILMLQVRSNYLLCVICVSANRSTYEKCAHLHHKFGIETCYASFEKGSTIGLHPASRIGPLSFKETKESRSSKQQTHNGYVCWALLLYRLYEIKKQPHNIINSMNVPNQETRNPLKALIEDPGTKNWNRT
jgi:hypothetical protein